MNIDPLELEISRRCAERPGLGRLQARREIEAERVLSRGRPSRRQPWKER